jgi:competence protein ComEA
MSLYTRHQILVLLVILGIAGSGLAVGHWRRLHPDLVERVERLDRAPTGEGATPAETPSPRSARRAKRAATPARAADETMPAVPAARVDLNRAPLDELTRLPGVGPVLAGRIVDARPYASVDEMHRVRGIGRSKLDRLRELLTVSER